MVTETDRACFMVDRRHTNWLERTLKSLEDYGVAVVEPVLEPSICDELTQKLSEVVESKRQSLSKEEFEKRQPWKILRFLLKEHPFFLSFVEQSDSIEVVRNYLSKDAILRNQFVQNLLPNSSQHKERQMYHFYHRNFRHLSNAVGVSLDVVVPLNDLTANNGSIFVVPGSHKWLEPPNQESLDERGEPIICRRGALIFTDGMLWHREEHNSSDSTNSLLLHQFTLPIIKQYVDWPRLLGEDFASGLSDSTRELLGFSSQVPSSEEEFFGRTEATSFTEADTSRIVFRLD